MPRSRTGPPPLPPFGKHSPRPGDAHPPGPPRLPPVIANSTTHLLLRAGHRVFGFIEEELSAIGLHMRHMPVLTALDAEGPKSQAQLTEMTWIDRTTMVALVDELEEMGLVERAKNPRDRRAYQVQLTPAGRDMVVRAVEAHRVADEATLEPLTPEERQTLRALLARLAEAEEPLPG